MDLKVKIVSFDQLIGDFVSVQQGLFGIYLGTIASFYHRMGDR